jgi:predicted patatin/cPLA2 family phospholipase
MRSVFAAGLLDAFTEANFDPFDFYLGVSGGAYNLAAFVAGVPGQSWRLFSDYALRREFISARRFLRGGHLLDLDWLFATAQADGHLDVNAVLKGGKPLFVCVTDVATGQPNYVRVTAENLLDALKASTAIPLVYRGFPLLEGRPSVDGGVSDAIPVAAAIERGARRIVVVCSRPCSHVKRDTLGHRYVRWKLRSNPLLVNAMQQRVARYQRVTSLMSDPPRGVSVIEVRPPPGFSAGRFSRDKSALWAGYAAGRAAANDTIRRWYTGPQNVNEFDSATERDG